MQSSGRHLRCRFLLTFAVSFIFTGQGEGYSVKHAGKCYWISDEAINFNAAKQKCLDRNSKMVQLTSPEVFDEVTRSLDANKQYWVGLTAKTNTYTRVTEYYWDDNSQPSSTQWSGNEPNFTGHCARLSRQASVRSSEHLLADNSCLSRYYYICERDIRFDDFIFAHGHHKVINGTNHCPMTSHPAASRLACSGSCALESECENFYFDTSSRLCTLYSNDDSCDVTMPDSIAVTAMNRLCA